MMGSKKKENDSKPSQKNANNVGTDKTKSRSSKKEPGTSSSSSVQGSPSSLRLLDCWAPITTRLLRGNSRSRRRRRYAANSNSWYVLDNVMKISTTATEGQVAAATIPHKNDQDINNNSKDLNNFVWNLRQELERNGILQRLNVARTQGERQANDIISLLQLNGLMTTTSSTTTQAAAATTTSSTHETIRGDKSTFLGRDLRCGEKAQSRFRKEFPNLNQLIERFEQTAHYYLGRRREDDGGGCMEFDFDLTSVQIAEFPGDGKSGYRRHCDRNGNLCQQEKKGIIIENNNSNNNAERLLTGVYYVTPNDWDQKLDGGCLRLFVSGGGGSESPEGEEKTIDIAPFSNRMIVFRSDGVEHEVLPSLRRPRLAITIWLYGRNIPTTTTTTTTDDCCSDSDDESDDDSSKLEEELTKKGKKLAPQAKKKSDHTNNNIATARVSGPPPLPIKTINNPRHPQQQQQQQSTIFVSIASYRDSEITPTLQHLMSMASNPERVFVGLMHQLDSKQDTAIMESLQRVSTSNWDFRNWYQSNVRCLQMEAKFALGPCYARALCQSLWRGEDYVLQIDSHMRFRQHWDTYLIEQLEDLIIANNNNNDSNNDSKVMLTAYPVGYKLPNHIPNETRGTLLVPGKFDPKDGLLRQKGRLFQQRQQQQQQNNDDDDDDCNTTTNNNNTKMTLKPIPCYLYAAGFNFSRSNSIEDCPYDERLHHLFFGEELSMAIRLFTKGYDLFAPTQSVCYHLWSRNHRPTNTTTTTTTSQSTNKNNSHKEQVLQQKSKQRSIQIVQQQLLGSTAAEMGRYGLGSVRTPKQFAKVLGVDFVNGAIVTPPTTTSSLPAGIDFVNGNNHNNSNNDFEFAPDSLEGKVQALDNKTKNLIASFLQQIS